MNLSLCQYPSADVMDKNKTLDDEALIEDYWHNKISEKYLSSGDLADDNQIPQSQVCPRPQISRSILFSLIHYQEILSGYQI